MTGHQPPERGDDDTMGRCSRPPRRIFGLRISDLGAADVARRVLTHRDGRCHLVVTPNIQHIDLLRHDAAFREAYGSADIVTCDGFPVAYYARLAGAGRAGRVTGCDIAALVLGQADKLKGERLFFVVDRKDTQDALQGWAARTGLGERVATLIPPFGFEADDAFCRQMAQSVRDHGSSILFMGVGAPRSDVFAHRYRDQLPPCWCLCVGQAVKMFLGLTPRPPGIVQALNLEWLWRIGLEPRRLASRYLVSTAGFLLAVIQDLVRAR
jgi:N-acetylglucosaminyldiphosphoundecaprenol N-acetyl-beta-D-mannosaminyltransferase